MEKTTKRYEIWNTVFIVLQIALLICANIVHFLQLGNNIQGISAYFWGDVVIMQLFFTECLSSILGGISYIKNLQKAMIWFDLLGVAASVFLMIWSSIWGIFIGVEGHPFPRAIYLEVPSLALLLVKTVVDGVIAIKAVIARRLKK